MLFSDIEQSTLLLTRLGRAYEQVLDGCRAAQRAAWTACGGVEMGTEGDSFFVVFAAAEDAVAAAVAAQLSLARHDWPNGERVRVRMGIHTGSPRIHDGGYVGIDVHRAARIAGAAHGGQVVVSDATAKIVAETLPTDVRLRDLGEHRLKDLNLPEHLHQLLIPGVPTDFPPLKSVGTISSLPVATTPLLGRRPEVNELAAQLMDRDVRLVTLTGPGGSGKTRLAAEAARTVVEGFPDGVYFVALAAVTRADNIWSSIGDALDLPAGDRIPPAFFANVAARRILLVLDNLEQVQGADSAVAELLRGAPDLVVLATSRRPLHLASEHQFAVAPLSLPDADTLEATKASPAVQLFVDRARAVRTTFSLTANNSTAVVAICGRLDGLPLAIEIVAAHSKVLGPRALLARLDHALDLRGPAADRPARQQALRDTIDWSYRLLPVDQQALFRRLGVFVAGADLHAVEAVCIAGGAVEGDLIGLAADLVDASLVTVTEDGDGEPRFAMLETVRAFALDALADAGEMEGTRRLHAEHFAAVAAQLRWRAVWDTPQQAIRGNRLFEVELNNFREALGWATTPSSGGDAHEPGIDARIAVALTLLSRAGRMWTDSDPAESRHWLEAVLDAAGGAETVEVGICLVAYAEVLSWQGELTQALEVAQRSVAILRGLGDVEVGGALIRLGVIQHQLGNAAASRRVFEEVSDLARQTGDSFLLSRALDHRARLQAEDGRWEAALQLFQESRQALEDTGADYYLAVTDHNMACVLRKLGRVQEAHDLMSREIQSDARTSPSMDTLSGSEDYAAVLADTGFAELAALLVGATDAERQRIGVARDDWQEKQVTEARALALPALSTTEWNASYARGRSMTILDALDEALASSAGLRL